MAGLRTERNGMSDGKYNKAANAIPGITIEGEDDEGEYLEVLEDTRNGLMEGEQKERDREGVGGK